MITVSNDFKNAVKTFGKQLKAYVTNGTDEITDSDDLQTLKLVSTGTLCRSIIRQAEIKYLGTHDYLEDEVNIGIGVLTESNVYEYIDYGKFKVVESKVDIAKNQTTLKAFDKMYQALQSFSLSFTYPITMKDLLDDICTELSWTAGYTTFANDDLVIASDIFSNLGLSYRDVLDDIAEASGSIIMFDNEDNLIVKSVSASPLDTLTKDNLFSFKLENKYGPINSIVLSRQPQEDNIVAQDTESIGLHGVNEFKIANNILVDSDRETYIVPVFNQLNDMEYYPFECRTEGLGYFEIGDRINIQNLSGVNHQVVIFDITIELSGGIKETLKAVKPLLSTTQYQYAGIIGQTIKNTQIIVDKQEGEISLIVNDIDENYYTKDETNTEINLSEQGIISTVSDVSTLAQTALDNTDTNSESITVLQGNITALQQTIDALQLQVQSIGGENLLKNSSGLNTDITIWQELDENGQLIDANNTATIDISTDTQHNTESGSGYKLEEQFIKQTVPTIIGLTYTLYLRFKKLDDCSISISGIISSIPLVSDPDETWTVFKYQFVAVSTTTSITISNVGVTGAYCIVSDIVLKPGDCTGWTQAPNEVYGKNYKFDSKGFEITSLTDAFKSLLDNTKLAVYDTSGGTDRVVMLVSKDSGIITRLIVQDEFTLQRYSDTTSALRMIPVSDGALIIIND